MKFPEPLHTQWQQSRAQLAANPRLGWGLWAIALLALFYANLWLSDERGLLHTRVSGLYMEQQDAASLAGNADWPARLNEAKARLAEQAGRFGSSNSESLARAEVQARLAALASRHNMERSRIDVAAAPTADAATGLVPLQASLQGQITGDNLLALLAGLEQGQPYYRIDSLVVTQGPRSKHINVNLTATLWYLPWEEQSP